MLAIDMKILGEPTFIQEEDCSFTALTSSIGRTNAGRTLSTGSLVFNDGDLLTRINFKFKNDIDTSPGGQGNFTDADKEAGIKARFFTGIYKVLTVQSNFERGVFTQNLRLVRLYNDEDAKRDAGHAIENPRDTTASLDQITDVAEIEWAAGQQGLTNTFGAVDPFGGLNDLKRLEPVAQKLTSGIPSSVNTNVTNLAGQARDKIAEVTQSNKRLVTVDGILQYENLGQPLSQAEQTKIWKELTRNAGDDLGVGE